MRQEFSNDCVGDVDMSLGQRRSCFEGAQSLAYDEILTYKMINDKITISTNTDTKINTSKLNTQTYVYMCIYVYIYICIYICIYIYSGDREDPKDVTLTWLDIHVAPRTYANPNAQYSCWTSLASDLRRLPTAIGLDPKVGPKLGSL